MSTSTPENAAKQNTGSMKNSPAKTTGNGVAVPNESADGGKTIIESNVVAKVIGIAARDVEGVYALGGGAARAIGAIRGAVGNTDLTQGVSVEVGEKQVAADLTIAVEYPQPLKQVADNVRAAVYKAVEDLVGLDVVEVNISITDIHIPSDDKDDKDDKETSRSEEKAEREIARRDDEGTRVQ